jgi:hypothetical protein
MPVQHVDGSNPPFSLPGAPAHVPGDAGDLARSKMLYWAQWCLAHRGQFTYTQGPQRWHMVESLAGTVPQWCDCSSFVTGLAKWAHATDPNGLHYRGGYTGTLLTHCNKILVGSARMGDLIVYGPGTGSHAVFIMEKRPNDFWVCSHGHQGDPSRVLHSSFLRYFGAHSARYLRWLS